MGAFYEGLAEILDIAAVDVSPALKLADHNWDSLSVVSTIALIDDVYDRMVDADALAACTTVADLDALVAHAGRVEAA